MDAQDLDPQFLLPLWRALIARFGRNRWSKRKLIYGTSSYTR